jgi:hypothetical protein
MERKMKKAISTGKKNAAFKRELHEKDRELHKLRKEIIDKNHTLTRVQDQLKDLKNAPPQRVVVPQRLHSANPSNQTQNNFKIQSLEGDVSRLQMLVDTHKNREATANKAVKQLQE